MDIGKIEQLTTVTSGAASLTRASGAYRSGENALESWKPSGQCQKCGKRPATETWSGGSMATIHGYAFWCKVCVVRAQLEHARQMVDRIAALEQELAALTGDGSQQPSGDAVDPVGSGGQEGPTREGSDR